MSRYLDVTSQVGGNSGQALEGATLSFFEAGPTSTFLTTYQDEDLTIPNTNPVVANGYGRFPDIWLQAQKYYVELSDKNGVLLDAQDNVTGLTVSGATTLLNIAALTALIKSSILDQEVFQVDGYYTQGDGGGDPFYWDSASAATADDVLVFASDEGGNGRWTRIISGELTQIMAGVVDDTTDQSVQLQAFFDAGTNLEIQTGNYVSEDVVTIPYGVNIQAEPGAHIDFSTASVVGNFPDLGALVGGDGSLTALPALNVSPSKGDHTLTFASAPSITQGQIIVLHDPTSGSWNGANASWTKGEHCRVARVSGSVVTLEAALYDGYTSGSTNTYELGGGTINISGSLQVTGPNLGSIATFKGVKIVDSDISGLQCTNSTNAEISLDQCSGVTGVNLLGEQTINSGLGLQYGLSIANCQDLDLQGRFYATRHGATMGGGASSGSIVNRNNHIRGDFGNTGDNGVSAADLHGNCEYCSYDGPFRGGVITGGDHNKFSGWTYARTDGSAVAGEDCLGWDHDFSNMYVYSGGDPSVRGVMDFGDAPWTAFTTRGGTLNLNGITLDAPSATRLIVIRNQGSTPTGNINVSLDNINYNDIATPLLFQIDSPSGDTINQVSGYGSYVSAAVTYSVTATTVLGFEENKTFNQVTAGGAATETFAIVFDRSFPTTPKVIVQPEKVGYGSATVGARAINVTKLGFDLVLFLVSGANLPASNLDISYQAVTGTG